MGGLGTILKLQFLYFIYPPYRTFVFGSRPCQRRGVHVPCARGAAAQRGDLSNSGPLYIFPSNESLLSRKGTHSLGGWAAERQGS